MFLDEDESNVFHTLNIVSLAVSNATLHTSMGLILRRWEQENIFGDMSLFTVKTLGTEF